MSEQTSALSVVPIERQLVLAMTCSGELFDRVAAIVSADDFEDSSARAIFEAIRDVETFRAPGELDIVSLCTWLKVHRLNGCSNIKGWMDWFAEAMSGLLYKARAVHNAHTVCKAAVGRRIMSELASLRGDLDATSPVDHEGQEAMLDTALDRVAKLIEQARRSGVLQPLVAHAAEVLANPDEKVGIPMGLLDLDNVTRGFHRGDVVIVAARTSCGKSTLALQLLLNASQEGAKVLLFSLEMTPDAVIRRALSNLSGLALFNLRRELNIGERDGLEFAISRMKDRTLVLGTAYDLNPRRLLAEARAMKERGGLDIVAVDYLQLMHDPSTAKLGRATEVATISRSMKRLALDLDCTVLAVAQLNRQADSDDQPRLSHLRESGALEQDANVVLLLHTIKDSPSELHCRVAKNTHGECRELQFYWDRPTYSVRNAASTRSTIVI